MNDYQSFLFSKTHEHTMYGFEPTFMPDSAVVNGRKGIGWELKPSYYKQAIMNMRDIKAKDAEQGILFAVS